jgi:hypothetical protein
MAGLTDISLANFTKIFVTDTVDYDTEITNVQSISEVSDEASVIDVPEYGVKYQRKLVGSATAGSVEVVVNLNPSDASFQLLEQYYTNSTRTKVKYLMLDGGGVNGNFVTFDALVSSKSLSSEFDAVRTVTFTLVIDGAISAMQEEV